MLSDIVNIAYGREGGDCTAPYYITKKKDFTVKEFIDEVLKNPSEWGSIKISFLSNIYEVGYAYGKIKRDNTPFSILDKKVKEVTGWGGWTLSNYVLYI